MHRNRVLIVEDEVISAKWLQHVVEEKGFPVVGVTGRGDAALKLADQHRPEKILMDISLLGGMDGIEAAENILKVYSADLIFMTGYESEEITARAQVLNPLGILIKPLDYPRLIKLLN